MRSLSVALLALLATVPAVAKDLALHQRSTPSVPTAEVFDSIEYLTPSLRIVDGPHARIIIDAKARNVTVLDKDTKTYWQTSFDSLRRQTAPLDKEREKAWDPELGAPVTLAPTGATETIAGHPCEENLLQGGTPAGSVCVAKDLESPLDPALWKDWPGLGNRLGPIYKVTDALGPKRIALRTVAQMRGKARLTILVTSVAEASPPEGLTAIPPDYARAMRHSQER